MITYTSKKWNRFSRAEKEQLFPLTLEPGSGFQVLLLEQDHFNYKKITITRAWDGDKVVGWSTVEQLELYSDEVEIGVFVSNKYRRRGIGTELVDRAIKAGKSNSVQCFMHDDRSIDFYLRFGADYAYDVERGYFGAARFLV